MGDRWGTDGWSCRLGGLLRGTWGPSLSLRGLSCQPGGLPLPPPRGSVPVSPRARPVPRGHRSYFQPGRGIIRGWEGSATGVGTAWPRGNLCPGFPGAWGPPPAPPPPRTPRSSRSLLSFGVSLCLQGSSPQPQCPLRSLQIPWVPPGAPGACGSSHDPMGSPHCPPCALRYPISPWVLHDPIGTAPISPMSPWVPHDPMGPPIFLMSPWVPPSLPHVLYDPMGPPVFPMSPMTPWVRPNLPYVPLGPPQSPPCPL